MRKSKNNSLLLKKFERLLSEAFSVFREFSPIYDEILQNPSFIETPKRFYQVLVEMSSGIVSPPPELKWFPTNSKGILIKGPIEAFSLCPHHLLPIHLKFLIGIKYDGYVLGISKITRTVIWATRKLLLQEDITRVIVDRLWNEGINYNVKGVLVLCSGEHLCEKIRGIKKGVYTITLEKRGEFDNNILQLLKKLL